VHFTLTNIYVCGYFVQCLTFDKASLYLLFTIIMFDKNCSYLYKLICCE